MGFLDLCQAAFTALQTRALQQQVHDHERRLDAVENELQTVAAAAESAENSAAAAAGSAFQAKMSKMGAEMNEIRHGQSLPCSAQKAKIFFGGASGPPGKQ